MAKAYLLVQVNIPDFEAYRASGYMGMAEKAVAAHGGRFLVRGGDPEQLEGAAQPDRIVILEFPSREAARGFWASVEYGPALSLRQSLSKATTVLLSEHAAA
jgi:uncharacterized protein (DUF1330 family)